MQHSVNNRPRKFQVSQRWPVVFYPVRKRPKRPGTGAGSGGKQQKCFCVTDKPGKIPYFPALQCLPPALLLVPSKGNFLRFYRWADPGGRLHINSCFVQYMQILRIWIRRFPSLQSVYFIQGQAFCSVACYLCFFAASSLSFHVSVRVLAPPPAPFCFSAPCSA